MLTMEELTRDIVEQKQSQKLIAAKKVAKWEKTGLLEGLDSRQKVHMARLLENEAAALLKEASDTGDIKGFQAIAFPMVRRVFGNLLAQEICSVQPMALPSGLIFWLDYTYGSRKAGTGADHWRGGGSIFGNPLSPLTGGAEGTGGHYYLHNSYTQREASASVGIASSASVSAWSEIDYDPELSHSLTLGHIHKITVDLDENAAITNVDTSNFKSFAVSGTLNTVTGFHSYLRRLSTFNKATNVLTVYFSSSAAGDGAGANSGSALEVAYVKKSSLSADTTGTTHTPGFEYAFDGADNIPEIDIKIASHAVTANDRKLKVKWTPEVAQDLNAYHSLDAEAELTQVMADQVALDIDAEILLDIVNNAAGGTFYWDRRPGFFVRKDTGEPVSGPSFTGTVNEWYQTLLETIVDVSNQIHRKTLKTGANFLVTSPDVCTILEALVSWRPVMDFSDPSVTKYSMGVEKMGSLSNRFTVYKAPFFFRNKILVGYKGTDWLTTGYVYAPYVPMIVTPTIYEPDNFTPRKAVMTRYAKQVVRPDFYGLVVIKGMDIF